jgi:hypothetical protein
VAEERLGKQKVAHCQTEHLDQLADADFYEILFLLEEMYVGCTAPLSCRYWLLGLYELFSLHVGYGEAPFPSDHPDRLLVAHALFRGR